MPRLKQPYNRHRDLQSLIYGAMGVQGYTCSSLAPKVGVKSHNTISSHIKDPDRMTLGELRRLCGALGISVDELRPTIKF